jgi:predicted nucleotidyltransferase
MMEITEGLPVVLDEIVDRLVRGMNPEQIYLFGSQALGKAGSSSDIDLLIVLHDSDLPRHRRESLSYDLLWGISTPVDLIVLTRNEFQRATQVKTSLPANAIRSGKLVYGKP